MLTFGSPPPNVNKIGVDTAENEPLKVTVSAAELVVSIKADLVAKCHQKRHVSNALLLSRDSTRTGRCTARCKASHGRLRRRFWARLCPHLLLGCLFSRVCSSKRFRMVSFAANLPTRKSAQQHRNATCSHIVARDREGAVQLRCSPTSTYDIPWCSYFGQGTPKTVEIPRFLKMWPSTYPSPSKIEMFFTN